MLPSSIRGKTPGGRAITPHSATPLQRRRLEFLIASNPDVVLGQSATKNDDRSATTTVYPPPTMTTTPTTCSSTKPPTEDTNCHNQEQDSSTSSSIFIFSPFGLCCRHDDCPNRPFIDLNERAILRHLKKHSIPKSSALTVRSMLLAFNNQVDEARKNKSIEDYRQDRVKYTCFACICGEIFPNKKHNAIRHCKRSGCDVTKISKKNAVRLRCGRYVTDAQVNAFYREPTSKINRQFDYNRAREILKPLLPKKEQHDHTYTHMYLPLIDGCEDFSEKIKKDFVSIHSPADSASETVLVSIHDMAEKWLLYYSQKNILMVPGNLRAGLQTFEGSEVNEVNQQHTYVMQHDPSSLLSEVKKLLSFSYRRGLFAERGFDSSNDFEVANFLKDLLLERPESVTTVPFVVEFCLMFPFRVKEDGSISMIACDTLSSVFSKIASCCKAGVCSVICSYVQNAFTVHGLELINEIRNAPVLHILSPIVRQIREMNNRIPKRRKTTLDSGNIAVDQFYFPFDDWSNIVPRTLMLMKASINELAIGLWWEPILDMTTHVKVKVETAPGQTADFLLLDITPAWKHPPDLPLDVLDSFTAQLEMAFHGFGGGSARMTELAEPTMDNCLYTNNSIYYSFLSKKVYNHVSIKLKEVDRKLPPVLARYFFLFRSLVQSNRGLFRDNIDLIFPSRDGRSDFGPSHVVRDLFNLESLPDMTQVRQFWAGVSNYVTGDPSTSSKRSRYLSSSDTAARKMGHSSFTHANNYASERVGSDEEAHFKAYHVAIGDLSYNFLGSRSSTLSLMDLREAMRLRYPNSSFHEGHNYLTLSQKELVEFGYGPESISTQHCLGLLPPGDGKSESYLIPTIARSCMATNNVASKKKTIIHVSPYGFLAGYQYANACSVMEKLGLEKRTSIRFYTGRDILEGQLPEDLSDKEDLPSLLFVSVDAMYNLFTFFHEDLKSWYKFVDKIVIDEVHTILSELSFREKYRVYFRLPVLGIPIVALSGSVPLFAVSRFAKRLCLSVVDDLSDMKVIHGGDVVGDFPHGFKIKVSMGLTYVSKVAHFVIKRLGASPSVVDAAHIFVAQKCDGSRLLEILSTRYSSRFVSSDTSREEVDQVASEWGEGRFNVLISTSIGLVGNENSRCRYLACAGYLYDCMQIVQAFGRLRKYMRTSHGEVLFAVPDSLTDQRLVEDKHRFTRLLNEKFLVTDDYTRFQSTMTSVGVRDWLIVASKGEKDCALRILSSLFGKSREKCGCCLFCRSIPTINVQIEAARRLQYENQNGQATERVLRRLSLVCLACRRENCRGIPILKGKGSKFLPENRGCCFSWNHCYGCGVSDHDRKLKCFDKSYLHNIACCECWVFKGVPGASRHDMTNCGVKGRLRRLLSHHYLTIKETRSFKQYIESIYTSSETFCEFMSRMEKTYMK